MAPAPLALRPAAWPRDGDVRLLHVDLSAGRWSDLRMSDLPRLLRPGDLLVVNDAATLPASLAGESRFGPIEVRLAGVPEGGPASRGPWPAVLFGAGSWRQRTEDRPAPPALGAGERVVLGDLYAEVIRVSGASPRLVELVFDREGDALLAAIHRLGRPVQYSYLEGALEPWHVQTPYAARPWAVEMPSAGRPLRLPLLRALRLRGVDVVALSHAAGLSSSGEAALDALLPLPERSLIPAETVEAIGRCKGGGGRIVAAGTTVVRALEGRAAQGAGVLQAGAGLTDLRLGPGQERRIVDGLLTGLHQPGGSHFGLLQSFAPRALLEAAVRHAAEDGYLGHEFGDLSLLLPA
jgi:S-adenosylmethionine:tRNA ribosyltransferase-isomerase